MTLKRYLLSDFLVPVPQTETNMCVPTTREMEEHWENLKTRTREFLDGDRKNYIRTNPRYGK